MIKKSFNYYIVHVPNKHIETFDTESVTIYKNTSMAEGFDHIRIGTVTCDMVFDMFGIKKGDVLYFHHNITNEPIGQDGIRKVSDWCIDEMEGLYKIPPSEIYGFDRDGVFHPIDYYCFIEAEHTYKINPDDFPNIEMPDTNKIEAKNYGRVVYANIFLTNNGIKKGDSVYFDPYSKYPFPVHGEKMWRMQNRWIIGKRDEGI